MKVARADITSVVTHTCQQLQIVKKKISDDVSNVNEEDLKKVIDILQHDTNRLAREINQCVEISPLDPKLKKDLRELIFSIQHSPAFAQAVGAQQTLLLNLFRKLENSISKFEQKVTRVDADPLH